MSRPTPDASRPAARSGYQARNVVNARPLKAVLMRRSAERGDPPDIAAWMTTHAWRYMVGNFQPGAPALRRIRDPVEAATLMAPGAGVDALPQWLRAALREEALAQGPSPGLWWLDAASAAVRALAARFVEFLHARAGTPLAGKLQRVNAVQALALWSVEHEAFAEREREGRQVHHPEAVALRHQGVLGRFVELLPNAPELRAEMAWESQLMRHCLGQFADRAALTGGYGEHYASRCEAGALRLFSLRTGDSGVPRITISAHVLDGGQLVIDQIKGKQNRPPIARYRDDVLAFLNTVPTTGETCPDALGMGVVRTPEGWCPLSEVRDPGVQAALAWRHPALLGQWVAPAPAAQWLAAARDPAALRERSAAPLSPGVRAALGMTSAKGG